MKISIRFVEVLMLATFLLVSLGTICCQPTASEIRKGVIAFYLKVVDLSEAGGNVERAVNVLNRVLEELERGNLAEASSLLKTLPSVLEEIEYDLRTRRMHEYLLIAAITVASILIGFVLYRFGPTAYYKFKAWYLGQYRLRRTRGRKPKVLKSRVFSEEVGAVIMAIIIVASTFAIAQVLQMGRVVEPFSALGTLGPRKKIGDYPREVVVGERIRLWIYVENHMGYPAYFRVLVKLGNRNTPLTANGFSAPVILSRERILLHNSSWLFPIDFAVEKEGVNYRLIVELWIYNRTTGTFTFTGRWNQIWFNVTRPALG